MAPVVESASYGKRDDGVRFRKSPGIFAGGSTGGYAQSGTTTDMLGNDFAFQSFPSNITYCDNSTATSYTLTSASNLK